MDDKAIMALFEQQRELIKSVGSGTRAKVEAEIDRVDEKIDQVIKHQERQNGRIDNLEHQTSFWRTLQRNPLIVSSVVILMVLGFIFAYSKGWINL